MALPKTTTYDDLPEVKELSREESLEALDKMAEFYLGMSGEEFLRRWEYDGFDDPEDWRVNHIGQLASLFFEEA